MPIAVLAKSFHVLEAMSEIGRPATLKDVVAATGMPKPTLHRILQTLTELGYVGQDEARSRYRLAPRLLNLTRGTSFEELKERALPLMQALHQRFDETVNLGILQGRDVTYLHVIETTQNLRWQVRPGTRDPYYSTALGRAMVAHLPENERLALIARTEVEPRTPFTVKDRAGLAALIEEARARGLAVDEQENDVGVICLGIPFPDANEVAAISVSVPASRMTPALRRHLEEALLRARPPSRSRPGDGVRPLGRGRAR